MGISSERTGPADETGTEGLFVGGWSRQASHGLVGYARKDGTNASKAVMQYLQTKAPSGGDPQTVTARIKGLDKPVITKDEIRRLESTEATEAQKRGLQEFKFATNEEMLSAIGTVETA